MGNDVSFDRLVELTCAEIRLFLRKVDQTDLSAAMKGSGQRVTDKLYGAMSERVRTFMKDEIDFIDPEPAGIEAGRQRCLQPAIALVRQDQLSWPHPTS